MQKIVSHSFKVEFLLTIQDKVYVMARCLSDNDFTMSGQPTLSGVPIENSITQPRKLRSDGTQDPDVFVFVLKNKTDESKILIGNEVELTI